MEFCMFVLLFICPPSELFLCSFVTLSGGGQRLHHTAGGQQSTHLVVVLPVEGSQGCSTRRVSPLALKLLPPAQQQTSIAT